jgi:diketogulonate reductase-like aldo/keto reductase
MNKYYKYKTKYLNLKKQIGGQGLSEMPQLCFGTNQGNMNSRYCTLDKCLNEAIRVGYRHIDGAQEYIPFCDNYFEIIRNAIRKVPREQIWITWKSPKPSIGEIQNVIRELDCKYIDLYLVHYGCDFTEELVEAKKQNLIRYYGVSNCFDLDKLIELKTKYDIYANQIQARPSVPMREFKEYNHNLIEECNKIGIKVMLFGSMMGLKNNLLSEESFELFPTILPLLNKYYIQKYILDKKNVLMVSSASCNSIIPNFTDFNESIERTKLLSAEQLEFVEQSIIKIGIAGVGYGM